MGAGGGWRLQYIENFFGNNIDLTAIVGQNGTGKTSLLRFFLKLSAGEIIDTDCVIVCEKDSKFWAGRYYVMKDKTKCKTLHIKNLPNTEDEVFDYEVQRFPFRSNVRFIYLTEMFNAFHYSSAMEGTDDLSFASVLFEQTEYGDEEKHINNPVVRYIHRVTDWQLAFISNGQEYVEKFNINYPESISIQLCYDKQAFSNLYIMLNSKNEGILLEGQKEGLIVEARNYMIRFLNIDKSISRSLKDECAIAIFMTIISSLRFVISYSKYEGMVLFRIINQIYLENKTNNAWDTVFELLNRIKQNNDNFNKNITGSKRYSPIFNDSISVNAERYMIFMEYFDNFLSEHSEYQINSEYYMISIPTKKMKTIQDFFNAYKECVQMVDFLSFSWGLSSGETLLLNQFCKIMHILKRNSNKKYYLAVDKNNYEIADNAVILLDEVEVAFHPEWQRIYLESFLKFIRENITNQGTHVQIILATHSPIILSDVPKQNAVFIEKDEANQQINIVDSKETFASNIFSLYKNAFFLDESAIGKFAENKLCELIDKIHDLYNSKQNDKSIDQAKEKIRNEIKCIGDEYIRYKFEKEFHYIVDMNEAYETE